MQQTRKQRLFHGFACNINDYTPKNNIKDDNVENKEEDINKLNKNNIELGLPSNLL